MNTLEGYEIKKELHSGRRSRIYEAIRKQDRLNVIVKTHAGEIANISDVYKLRHEFEIGKDFQDEQIIKYYDAHSYGNRYVLIEEDFKAISLKNVIPADGLSLDAFLQMAIQVVDCAYPQS